MDIIGRRCQEITVYFYICPSSRMTIWIRNTAAQAVNTSCESMSLFRVAVVLQKFHLPADLCSLGRHVCTRSAPLILQGLDTWEILKTGTIQRHFPGSVAFYVHQNIPACLLHNECFLTELSSSAPNLKAFTEIQCYQSRMTSSSHLILTDLLLSCTSCFSPPSISFVSVAAETMVYYAGATIAHNGPLFWLDVVERSLVKHISSTIMSHPAISIPLLSAVAPSLHSSCSASGSHSFYYPRALMLGGFSSLIKVSR